MITFFFFFLIFLQKQTTEIGYQDAVMQNQHVLLEGKTGADLKGKENQQQQKHVIWKFIIFWKMIKGKLRHTSAV